MKVFNTIIAVLNMIFAIASFSMLKNSKWSNTDERPGIVGIIFIGTLYIVDAVMLFKMGSLLW